MAAGTNIASKLFTLPKQASLANSKLYFFRTGTSTAAAVYTNIGLSVAHDQPVQADSDGRFAPIYIDGGAGDLRVSHYTSADVLIYTIDNYLASYGSTPSLDIKASSNPLIQLVQTGAASNNKNWYVQAESQQFKLSAVNDAFSSEVDFLTASRSGTTVTTVNLGGTALTHNADYVPTGDSAIAVSAATRNTTTSLAADSILSVALKDGSNYVIECAIYFTATTTAGMGFKFDLSASGGAAVVEGRSGPLVQYVNGTGAVATLGAFPSSPVSLGTISTGGTVDSVHFTTYATCSGADGTVALRWAQVSSSANNLNRLSGSWITARRIRVA
jgi:hypothetical protein